MKPKPDAWLYEEFDTQGQLRARHIWTFLPDDLKQAFKLKDVHHFIITPLYRNDAEKQTYNKDTKYNSKKLTEAFCGL
jgi:hypothetical protein